jgi:hypothetical protein
VLGHTKLLKEEDVTQLRQKMLEELQRRNYSPSTIRYYLRTVKDFAYYFGKSPDRLGPEELRRYQIYLLKERKLGVRSVASRVAALRFFFIRADGEFQSWKSVEAAIECDFDFIIANKKCDPPFERDTWYRPWKRRDIEFNSCTYQPIGWDAPCRFVVMRILNQREQCVLFEEDNYTYRIFCTNLSSPAHKVIDEYDKRADVENLVGEAKREGLEAIPSTKFKNNYAFFQLVMLSYNIWRYIKLFAAKSQENKNVKEKTPLKTVASNTIRIARLKMLFIAAKVVRVQNRDKVKYSIHEARTPAMMRFLEFLDKARSRPKPWDSSGLWPQRFVLAT